MTSECRRLGAAIVSVLVLAACSAGSHSPSSASRSATGPDSTGHTPAAVVQPRDSSDASHLLTAFLDATYTPNAAGGWYRGGGERSVNGSRVSLEILVRASTAAEARTRCPAIERAAGYFLRGFEYQIAVKGRIDVRSGNAVTFKDATFPPVTCAAVKATDDPVRATMPGNATAATARLSAFLDDYLDGNDWFGGAIHNVGAGGAQVVDISVFDGAAAAPGHCTTIRPLIRWFLGPYKANVVVEPNTGRSVTC